MTYQTEYKAQEREVIQRLRDYAGGTAEKFSQPDAWFIFGVLTRTLRAELEGDATKQRIEDLAVSVGVKLESH
jgi:hypothetical protein